MSDRERTDAGTFAETVTLDAVVSVFDEVRGPVITSSDVSEALDCSTEAARQKLTKLYEEGRVDKRKTGRTTVWWHTGGEPITPDERGDIDAESRREGEPDRMTSTPSTATDTAEESDEIARALDGWRPGRSPGEKREQQRTAGGAALEYLRKRGVATAAEFREHVEPEAPVEGQSPSTWWKKSARPALNRAREAGLVTFKDGSKEWRWAGEEGDSDPVEDSNLYDPTEEF